MLASSGQLPPPGARYAAEFKVDGARTLTRCSPDGTILLASRTLRDTTSSYPELVDALRTAAHGRGLVLDGEVIAPDPTTGNVPSFSRLQRRLHVGRPSKSLIAAIRVEYVVFDVLADGVPIRTLPYRERRSLLDDLGLDDGDRVRVPPAWLLTEHDPGELLLAAAAGHAEGLVSKALESPYEAGRRSRSWIKAVLRESLDAIVLGAIPGTGPNAATFGALVLGGYDAEGRIRVIGTVGSGFSAAARHHIRAALDQLRRDTSPVADPVPAQLSRAAWWVDPVIIAEIHHREASAAGLRHPSFKAIRTDKLPSEIGLPGEPAGDTDQH
nr:RNA ligase family protein [Nocardia sp. XZ_19_231]